MTFHDTPFGVGPCVSGARPETGWDPQQASRRRRERIERRWKDDMQDADGRGVGEAGGEPIMTLHDKT